VIKKKPQLPQLHHQNVVYLFKIHQMKSFYAAAGAAENVKKSEIHKYKRKQWTSFEQFKDLQFRIWKVTLPDNALE
jgi:hypothetical protein